MNKNRKMLLSVVALSIVAVVGFSSVFAATTVSLGAADDFAVLAGSAITATTPSVVSGHTGLSPAAGTFYTGLTTGQVTGTIYAVDATGPAGASGNNPTLLTSAKAALVTAYGNAGQSTTGVISADLGGQTFTPGVYDDNDAPDSLSLTGTVTLNAQGDANAVFIFKTGSTLTTASGSTVSLINGAQACNVFWQVGSSATLGTNSTFKGNILAMSSITDNGGSTVEGRFLARNGAVTLNNTTLTKATCVTPPPPPAPVTTGTSNFFEPLPLINVTKIPNPLALPGGPGSVTYTYTLTNVGEVAMGGVWVKDNKCSTISFISGDTNNDSKLDKTEAWKYQCTKVVSLTETNTATAHGNANGWDGYDTANATVVVGAPLTPPLIHVVKKPNLFVLPPTGGAVTYSYTVTNPGTAPLDTVSVIDDKCTGLPGRVVGHPGDINKNNLLESNESWSFTCQTQITQTTTNIATAEGSANGLTAIDFSPATVAVISPTLPNTGISPNAWNVIIPSILALVLLAVYTARKKRSI